MCFHIHDNDHGSSLGYNLIFQEKKSIHIIDKMKILENGHLYRIDANHITFEADKQSSTKRKYLIKKNIRRNPQKSFYILII